MFFALFFVILVVKLLNFKYSTLQSDKFVLNLFCFFFHLLFVDFKTFQGHESLCAFLPIILFFTTICLFVLVVDWICVHLSTCMAFGMGLLEIWRYRVSFFFAFYVSDEKIRCVSSQLIWINKSFAILLSIKNLNKKNHSVNLASAADFPIHLSNYFILLLILCVLWCFCLFCHLTDLCHLSNIVSGLCLFYWSDFRIVCSLGCSLSAQPIFQSLPHLIVVVVIVESDLIEI